jgi:diguanylate cyclase (GGDEF)-like protein/PAS domain S-box-containing protein
MDADEQAMPVSDRDESGTPEHSEAWWRSLVQNATDSVTVVDGNGVMRFVSPAVERILGYTPEELVGRRLDLTIDDRNRPLSERYREVLARPGATVTETVSVRHRDGLPRTVERTITNLLHDPAVRGLVVNSRDVTEQRATERALLAGEARYRAIVDDQTELVCRYLPDMTLTFVNRAFAQFYGGAADDWVGRSLLELVPPEDRVGEIARLASFRPDDAVHIQTVWEVRHDEEIRWIEWTDRALFDAAGRMVEVQSVGRDVHEQHLADRMLAGQATVLEKVARGRPLPETLGALLEVIAETNPNRSALLLLAGDAALKPGAVSRLSDDWLSRFDGVRFDRASDAVTTAVAMRRPVVCHDVMSDALWTEHRAALFESGVRSALTLPLLASDGDAVLGVLTVFDVLRRAVEGEDRRLVESLARLAEIAIERKAFEDRLAHSSLHDPLTGLPNRSLLLDRLGHALGRARRAGTGVAILFLDLDGFKVANDSLGHAAGDRLLVALARRLERALRPGDTVARFGGDEFCVLCDDLPPGSARSRAVAIGERILGELAEPFSLDGSETFLQASIGIALGPSGAERPDDLLRDADAAMYHAKDSGKGRWVVFDDEMRVQVQNQHATFNALHRAIERDELRVMYQPFVRVTDGDCIGAEALVRWQHPERGLLLPKDFVPLAEHSDLVVALGAWVLEESCRAAAEWSAPGAAPRSVAVNLSGRQLARPDLADQVAAALDRSGLRPELLWLEITESVLMRDAEGSVEAIERLKALGVRFAIDDFGTGYSSLTYLQRFPVDAVKIDRSFIAGVGSRPGDAAIVVAVLGLAHALGLQVVAEGVERAEQLLTLDELGCDLAQGFLFAPPLPEADFVSRFAPSTRRRLGLA